MKTAAVTEAQIAYARRQVAPDPPGREAGHGRWREGCWTRPGVGATAAARAAVDAWRWTTTLHGRTRRVRPQTPAADTTTWRHAQAAQTASDSPLQWTRTRVRTNKSPA